jgi:hypothetical protein
VVRLTRSKLPSALAPASSERHHLVAVVLVFRCEDLFEREREAWLSTSMASKLLSKGDEGEDEEAGAVGL